ncbi:MAG: hypothetical protein A2787_00145 [Omnitrophica WOR_2 bacterium RIFCSPHIGHO2_01_FULL_48_9]|nr:MAG: hypothetical protein A2787_00145 [Omnitrophica WOR_2 bacterium RIFCSPHIGHO2_01_FULL_48_9]
MKKDIPTLDAKDRKLIMELERNARASVREIARNIRASKEVTNYRLKRLIDTGIVKGFFPVIDYFSIGLNSYKILFNLYNFDETLLEKIMHDMKKVYGANYSILVQSIRDLEINLWIKHPMEFYDFYDAFLNSYSTHIQNKEFFLVTRIYYKTHEFMHGGNSNIMIGTSGHCAVDKTDMDILDELSKNARMPTIEIAKRLKLSPNTVQYRIRQLLQNGVIKGFRPRLDVSLLGYDTYKVLIMLGNSSKRRQLIQTLLTEPNVVKISKTIGNSDMEIKVNFTSLMELENFLRKMRVRNHSIRNFEIIAVAQD